MSHIEVEARSFITKDKYEQLLVFFKSHSKFIKEDNQETWYFEGPQDFRIQKNDFTAKIIVKSGKVHDPHRKEIEVQVPKESFEALAEMVAALGYQVAIKWFRKRHEFSWDSIKVCLDDTKGYGYIIELERSASDAEKNVVYNILQQKLMNLDVVISSREEFEQRFQEYKENWKECTKKDIF